MNMFRLQNGKLDKKYLRVCAVYKLLKDGRIKSKDTAERLLREVNAENVLSHWLSGPLKDRGIK